MKKPTQKSPPEAADAIPLTHYIPDPEERANERKPLQFSLIARLFSWTRPYTVKRNLLFGLVIARSIQLPLLAWMTAAIIGGPIRQGDTTAIAWRVLGGICVDHRSHVSLPAALGVGAG